jgi:hypothetical protein
MVVLMVHGCARDHAHVGSKVVLLCAHGRAHGCAHGWLSEEQISGLPIAHAVVHVVVLMGVLMVVLMVVLTVGCQRSRYWVCQ